MADILTRAGCFAAIIVLGITLRRLGVFKETDFRVLSTIVIKITLPATIIFSFAGQSIDPSMLTIAAIGFGGGILYLLLGYLLNLRSGKDLRAFEMLNLPGYNIGNFTLPFVQSFLGPMGVITTSLFDTGNAMVCLGGAFGIAATVKDGRGFSVKLILDNLLHSVPFVCYILLVTLNLAKIPLPSPLLTCLQIIANANAFLAMLMLGVGIDLSGGKSQMRYIAKHLAIRYSLAAVFALVFYFLLPFELEVRRALAILTFAPFASATPVFTEELKEDRGLSATINSFSVVCSIVFIILLLVIML